MARGPRACTPAVVGAARGRGVEFRWDETVSVGASSVGRRRSLASVARGRGRLRGEDREDDPGRRLEGAKKGVGERKDAPVRGGTTRGRRGAPATYLDRDRQRERGLGLGLGLAILGRLALGGGWRLVAHRAMRSGASAGPRRGSTAAVATKKSKTHARRAPIAFASRMKILPANQRPAWASSQANRKAEPVKGDPRATSLVFKHPTTARRTPHRRQNGRCHQRLHRRARRRPQGASRFGVDRSRERRARVSGEDHANIASRSSLPTSKPRERRTYLTPSSAPLLHPQRVAARRTFFGKGVAGIAPVRYV